MRFEGSMIRKQAAKSELKNVDITQPFSFKIDFVGAETTLRMYFTVLENNVTIHK